MYSPIRDPEGNSKPLYDITYEDLHQLSDVEEGYSVEYKSTYEEMHKRIANIVCSFANSSGGWLFVGVNNDGSLCDIQVERSDFSQTIGQLVKCHVSPLPLFECRFVANPSCEKAGVLIVRVEEGFEEPYVSSGTVYVRTGSNTEPVKAENSSVLRNLEDRRRRKEGERNHFYSREIYYPVYLYADGRKTNSFPMLNVYLFRFNDGENNWIESAQLDLARKQIDDVLRENDNWANFVLQETPRSFVIRQGAMNSMDNVDNVIELFRNGSIKVHIPLYILQNEEKRRALERLSGLREIKNPHLFDAVNGVNVLGSVLSCTEVVEELLESHVFCGKRREYLVAFELEACHGLSIYSENRFYDEYVKKSGIPFFTGANVIKRDEKLSDYVDVIGEASIQGLTESFILETMGFPWFSCDARQLDESMQVILGVVPGPEDSQQQGTC